MKNVHQQMPAMQKHWLCTECGFRMPSAPAEEEPKHCPRCFKNRERVKELKKIPASY